MDTAFHDTLRERKKLQTRLALHEAALRLIEEQGEDATTIEQICQGAEVSPRTFFNYFPSKAAAALNLPESLVPPSACEQFLAAQGELVPALCALVVEAAGHRRDRHRIKDLVARRPELFAAFSHWMAKSREDLLDTVAMRTDSRYTAELAVGLVMTALGVSLKTENDDDRPELERLLAAVDRMIAVRDVALRDR